MFNEKTVLITGGTGSFGKKFIQRISKEYNPKKIIVFSRDEFKQSNMQKEFDYPNIRFFLGDVRDKERLNQAFQGVDIVIHAAALKQVPALEYNPTEAIKTNVQGAVNIVDAAIACGVQRVVGLSTDKAVNPVNLYGATKLCMEKVFMSANSYNKTHFSCVRYGNVIGSRGSVIPYWQELISKGIKELPITDTDMTRFWLTLDEAVDLVYTAVGSCDLHKIFVPDIKAMPMWAMAKAVCPESEMVIVGTRPGEKKHEILISEDNRDVVKVSNGIIEFNPAVFCSCGCEQYTIEQMRELI